MCAAFSFALVVCLFVGARAAAQAPQEEIVFEGTVRQVQRGVPLCGVLATAVWVLVDVDRVVRAPSRRAIPARVRVMVQCHGARMGARYRFTVEPRRPTRAGWEMFDVGEAPRDGVPLFWAVAPSEPRPP